MGRQSERQAPPGAEQLDAVAEGFASIPEAAAFLRVSRATVYTLMESGQLKFAKFGRARRLPWRALREYAARCVVAG